MCLEFPDISPIRSEIFVHLKYLFFLVIPILMSKIVAQTMWSCNVDSIADGVKSKM